MTREPSFEPLLAVARDLTASLATHDRHARLLAAVCRALPCDAACLLALEGDALVPVAAHGLVPAALSRRYARGDHPRLDVILKSGEPVRFAPDSKLADPFEGLLAADPHALHGIHACLGCRLTDGHEVVGALTADALRPDAFDGIADSFVATLGALAGAAVRTARLIEALETKVDRRGAAARARSREVVQSGFLGSSAAARRLLDEIALVAPTDLPVLITGETGVGKELVAHLVHGSSPRADEPLVQVNCAALPESVAESELFGHVAGAFTGAVSPRAGRFELADGGTLLLDEVGELPPLLQPKLLRALQQGEIQRVGSDRPLRVNVRVLAATNRDLRREVERGRFRADLYHRLAGFPIHVPPLRERLSDLPLLAAALLDRLRRQLGCGRLEPTAAALAALAGYAWPGNVRELENVLSRAALRAASEGRERTVLPIEPRHLDLRAGEAVASGGAAGGGALGALAGAAAGGTLAERLEAYRRAAIEEAVERNGGNWAAAARALGLHRANLHALAVRLGLKPRR
ncbi:MAG: nitric oxide reductase transcriptional regulator NorR [Planctomycetes bacterium]|nr:nitric oxide reductase transcriptional regulator NorR [Planctomycetota bacterium]